MKGRFYFFGTVVSLTLHGALFFLLAVGSCKAKHPETTVPANDATPVAETNATEVADVPEPPREVSQPRQEAVRPRQEVQPRVADPFAEDAPKLRQRRETEREWKTYVVKPGDTLMILARKTECSVSEIAKMNKKTIAAMAKLKVGQRIKLPAVEGANTPLVP